MNSLLFVPNAFILLFLNTHYAHSSIKFLEVKKESGKIINMGEVVVIEQVLKFECTLVSAGRVETSNAASVFVV